MFRILKNNFGAASWPAAKKTFSDLVDGTTIMEAVNVNTVYDEVEALQTFLGALGAGNTQSYSASLMDTIQGLRVGAEVTYVGAAEVSVAAGRIVFESSGKYRMRENTSATSVTWANIDTGAEGDDTYYVYAVADAEATTFTIMVSLSATTPTGATYYKRLGYFINDTDIVEYSVVDDSLPIPRILDYATSASAFTARAAGTLKICYGLLTIAGDTESAVTNLPFTSAATYTVSAVDNGMNDGVITVVAKSLSGSELRIRNSEAASRNIHWLAIGT